MIQNATLNIQTRLTHQLCAVPLAGFLFSTCAEPETLKPYAIPDYPQLVHLQTKFEGILESSAGGALALDLQYSEMAVRDLGTMVKNSDLLDKEILGEKLEEFVYSAREAGVELLTLGSRVGSVVDRQVAQSSLGFDVDYQLIHRM